MLTKLHSTRALPLLTTVGLAVLLGGCNTFSKHQRQDNANPSQSDYYVENNTQRPKVRVSDPDAAGMQSNKKHRQTVARDVEESVMSDHPSSYTVVKGDTLWDISGEFLSKPWLWPEIWNVNPQIANPHLIYPGDEVALRYIDGKPMIVVSRDGQVVNTAERGANFAPMSANQGGTEKLSPRIFEESLANAIPTIPGDAIQQFLIYPRVVDKETITTSAYVIGDFEGRLASATGHQIYVRGGNVNEEGQTHYGIFRKSEELRDPDSNELLGYEVTHVGDANLLYKGDPATMVITSNRIETIAGDRIMSQNQNFAAHNYVPRVPIIDGEGKIISLFDAISQTGRGQVVVVNLGSREGVRIGDVMAIEHRGGRIRDKFSGKSHDFVDIPNTRIGVMMVFRTFDKVAYGLIMESQRPIRIHDAVTGI